MEMENTLFTLLPLFNQETWWLLSHPETRQHPPLEGALNLLQQSDLLPAFAPLGLLHFFNGIKIEDTSWMIKVYPDGGSLGNIPDFGGNAIEPHLVVASTPPKTPGVFILSQLAGSVASPPPCIFIGDSDDHPSWVFHFPVSSEAQYSFFTKYLKVKIREWN